MSGILLPEIVIYNTLEAIVTLLRSDLKEHESDLQNSILYKILGVDEDGKEIKMNLYNYFIQAKKIITTEENLSVNFGYNQEVAKIISLHILLPSEHAKSTIGEDEGYIEDDIIEEGVRVGKQGYYTQLYDCTYQIMITSNNSSEVNVVYNVLKSMLLMLVPNLELMGIRIPELSGNDIMMQDDLTPVPIFHKVLNLTFKYEHIVPKLIVDDVAKKFHYAIRMIDYNGNSY